MALKYANQQYGKSGDLANQRVGARSQMGGASSIHHNGKLSSGVNLVAQSLDPVKLSMAKRKASNDDSRFKNANSRYGGLGASHQPNKQNLMAPFLD